MILSIKNFVRQGEMIQYAQHTQGYWVPQEFPYEYDKNKLQFSVHRSIFIIINSTQYYSDN